MGNIAVTGLTKQLTLDILGHKALETRGHVNLRIFARRHGIYRTRPVGLDAEGVGDLEKHLAGDQKHPCDHLQLVQSEGAGQDIQSW